MNFSEVLNKRLTKVAALAISDAILLFLSFTIAIYISGCEFGVLGERGWLIISAIILIQLAVFLRFGLYRAILRYASVDSVITIVKTVTISMAVLALGLYILQRQLPARALFLDWLITIFFIGGNRFVVRYYFELRQRFQRGRRVLIYGAGDMGSLALRQLLLNKEVLYSPIGFIDDDRKKHGFVVRGVKVLGSIDHLDDVLERHRVEEVVVAIAEIASDNLRNVVNICKQKGVICRIIPCFSRLVQLEPDIRNVELADLMRRTPRDLDKNAIEKYLHGKVVLITGAAGSIGSEIVRQCLSFEPKLVIALDQSEFGLYSLNEELGSKDVKYVLCDTTNRSELENVFKREKPDIIFHAAAYKHVPLLELNATEGVRNNITSTKNLCELAEKYSVSGFVMISTDKAVKPSNIMGATKKICELIVQSFNKKCSTKYVSVRFGNVLGSSGSVVPKFIDQIRKGGPVTVTHPDATRYFMLIEEAVQLVLQSASIGNGGEIFILDMGKPVRIADMAEDLIYLMGRQPHKDIEIHFPGLRPGEKIHEELFNDEIEKQTKFKEITVGRTSTIDWTQLGNQIDQLIEVSKTDDRKELVALMKQLVPEGTF